MLLKFYDFVQFRVGALAGYHPALLARPGLRSDDSVCILYCSFSSQFSRDPIIAERGLRYRVGYLGVTSFHSSVRDGSSYGIRPDPKLRQRSSGELLAHWPEA